MPVTKPVQSFKRPEDEEAMVLGAISKVGPRNVAEISRLTGVHQETVRYKFKKRFGRLGFRFHAEIDYASIGLQPYWAEIQFAAGHAHDAPQVLRLLNRIAYLTYFGKMVPSGEFHALFALPSGRRDELEAFLGWLQEKGVVARFSVSESVTYKHAMMDPSFFNFRSGRWEVDWSRVSEKTPVALPVRLKPKAQDVDYYDLLILKELQKDALQHITVVARTLKVPEKTLEYHYRTHVMGKKLVRSYLVRWTQDTRKSLAHSVAAIRLSFKSLGPEELKRVQGAVSKIPYLWMEDVLEDGTYVASMYVPLEDMMSVMGYINGEVPDLGPRAIIGMVKINESSSFTIPYESWKDGDWQMDVKRMKSSFSRLYKPTPEKKRNPPPV